ncbi:MAG: hypothetical protein ABI824_06995 [Acidobacteriota bacterium]
MNNTSGTPQAGVKINVVQPGADGMKQLGSTTSIANGTFTVDATPSRTGPALIQSIFGGVTYTTILPPGTPTNGVNVSVYDATDKPPEGMKTQHLILLEPGPEKLEISETFFTTNESKLAYQDEKNGSVRFYLPPGAPENLSVTIDSTGVPIQRPVEKAGGGLFKINYPLKPGETRFDLHYAVPATAEFVGKVLTTDPPTRLVTPTSVTLSGDGLADLGQETQTGARVYAVSGNSFKVTISGVGAIRADVSSSDEESGAPKCCDEVPPRIYTQEVLGIAVKFWILALAGMMLLFGGTVLYRRGKA